MALTTALCYLFLLSLLFVLHQWLNARQPSPYMDELFHVSQAQQFCKSFLHHSRPVYHSAITTPPGIYLLPGILSYIVNLLFGESLADSVCSTSALRGFSALWAVGIYYEVAKILALLAKRRGPTSQSHDEFVAFAILFHPPLFFFAQLFYTDVGSVCMILMCWRLALEGRTKSAAFAGVGAVLMRQTNVVWHMYIVLEQLIFGWRNVRTFKGWWRLLLRQSFFHFPHAVAFSLYLMFLYWNGALVLGDKINHEPVLHFSMLLYFLGYRLAFGYPLSYRLRDIFGLLKEVSFSKYSFLKALVIALTMVIIIGNFTYVHPFILSDNRHYAFYLFRKVLLRNNFTPYLPIPLYLISLMVPWQEIQDACFSERKQERKQDLRRARYAAQEEWRWAEHMTEFALLVCAALALVPAKLVEPRYFIVPTMFYLLRSMTRVRPSIERATIAACWNLLLAMMLFFVFNELPFERAVDQHMTNDLSPGRFML